MNRTQRRTYPKDDLQVRDTQQRMGKDTHICDDRYRIQATQDLAMPWQS